MDIASLSTALATSQLQTDFSIGMLSKTLDSTEVFADTFTKMIDAASMERSVYPSIGGNIDLSI